MKFYFKLCTSC